MRRTLTMAALVLALCCPALAGEMHTPVATPPPAIAAQEPTADGEIPNGLTETVLSLLGSLLALL